MLVLTFLKVVKIGKKELINTNYHRPCDNHACLTPDFYRIIMYIMYRIILHYSTNCS